METGKDTKIPPILDFASLKEIKESLGAATFYSILSDVEGLTGKKPSAKQIKKYISENEVFLKMIFKNEALKKRFEFDSENFESKKETSKQQRKEVNSLMSLPKKQYKGCIATRLDTEDYEFCNREYDNPKMHYEKYSALVPTSLIRQNEYEKAYNRGDEKAQKILYQDPELTIRDLPRGIRLYMNENPEKYNAYLQELKAEQRYLKAIKNSVASNIPMRERHVKYEEMYNSIK